MFKAELHLTVLIRQIQLLARLSVKVKKLRYFIKIYFYAFLRSLKYFFGGSQLFSMAFSRRIGESLEKINTEDGSFALKKIKNKKKDSNKLYPRCFCVK